MDNKQYQGYQPATEPVVRTRQRSMRYAQAVQEPAEHAYQAQQGEAGMPAVRKRSSENALAMPIVYEPSGRTLRTPSVEPLKIAQEGKGLASRSTFRLVLISIILGALSGLLLIMLHEQNNLFFGTDISGYREGEMFAHCLIWGGVLGLLYGLILSPIHRKLPSTLPVYAALLFLPVIHFMLTPLMATATELLVALVQGVISLAIAAVGLFFVWSFFFG